MNQPQVHTVGLKDKVNIKVLFPRKFYSEYSNVVVQGQRLIYHEVAHKSQQWRQNVAGLSPALVSPTAGVAEWSVCAGGGVSGPEYKHLHRSRSRHLSED